jgi:uncharacterized membrane protein YecN with MAPEG domain
MKPIPTILPAYAAILAIFFVVLSIRTIRQRRKLKIGLGDAGNNDMQRAVRVHANFAEYVPLGLLMIYLVEQSGVYGLCICCAWACWWGACRMPMAWVKSKKISPFG